jgi:transposase
MQYNSDHIFSKVQDNLDLFCKSSSLTEQNTHELEAGIRSVFTHLQDLYLTYIQEVENKLHELEIKLQQSEERLQEKEEDIEKSEERARYMQFEIDQLKRLLFGAKRERFISNIPVEQLPLPFDTQDTTVAPPSQIEQISYTREKTKSKPKHPGRLDFPAHLPVEEIIIEPEESVEGLKFIGNEITKELDYTPAKLFVRHYIRPKYARPDAEGIVTGQLPVRPIEKSSAGPGLLAIIPVEKYVDHLPLYRQIERYKREGINISDSTIGSWTAQIADLINPLYQTLVNQIISQGYIQVDETPIKVLDKNKKGKTHQGYYWVYNAPMQNAVFYHYCQGRGREGPMKLLENFKGYMQTDGYSVYDWFAKKPGIIHTGCMAHARRYFEKALSYDAQKADQVMTLIQQLYAVEREAKEAGLAPEQRKVLRLDKSLPVMNKLGALIAKYSKTALPKSPMGIALAYSIQRWDNLLAYLYDGCLEIDNNLVENAIRPNALGRKNYLFAGSHDAAQRAAIFYSLFGTCKKNNVNPYLWLKKVLEVIPEYPANKLTDLLPQNLKI